MLDHRLEIFIRAADKGSFTDVANALFITQPAVSKAIKSLEEELDVKLFYRDKRNGLLLTEVGKKILVLARQEADTDSRIYQTAYQENHFIGGKLRIGSLPILCTTILSGILPAFREKYPLVAIDIREGTPAQVRRMCEEHAVDIALSCSPFNGMDHKTLIRDRMVGIYKKDMENPPAVIDLTKDTGGLIAVKAAVETVQEELAGRQRIDFSRAIVFEIAETVVNMVEKRNGPGIISEFTLAEIPNDLVICPLKPDIPIDIGVEAADMTDLPPAASAFLELLLENYPTEENSV